MIKFKRQKDLVEKMRFKAQFKFNLSSLNSALILFVFFVAFVVRIIYIMQLRQTYFFVPFKDGYDDYIFDKWAGDMLAGNWLGDRAIFIYRMPLYVYFLWGVYFLFGHNYLIAYVIQAAIAALACVLVYIIGVILSGKRVGLIAGLLNALYGPSIYYAGMLVGEVLGIFINCVAFLSLLFFQRLKKSYHLFIAGICIGLSVLLRGNALIVLPFIIFWIIIAFRKDPFKKILSYLISISLGVLLAISPITIRNYIYTKDIVPITAFGGINIYIGNAYGANGKFRCVEGVGTNLDGMIRGSVRIAEENSKRKLKPSEVSDFWVKETIKSIKEHRGSFLIVLFIKKIVFFWNNYEIPDIWDYYFFKKYIPLLKIPLFNFSIIAAFGFAGMYLSWRRRKELSLLYVFLFGYMFSLLLFFVASRYRIHVVPFLSVFAAYSMVEFMGALKQRRKLRIYVATVIFIAFFLFSHIPIKKISFATSHADLGKLLHYNGKLAEAMKEYNKAIELDPGNVSAYNNLGIICKRLGRIDEAVKEYETAIGLDPAYAPSYYNLGILYLEQGQFNKAIEYFNKTILVDPNFIQAHKKIAACYEATGDSAKAAYHLSQSQR